MEYLYTMKNPAFIQTRDRALKVWPWLMSAMFFILTANILVFLWCLVTQQAGGFLALPVIYTGFRMAQDMYLDKQSLNLQSIHRGV